MSTTPAVSDDNEDRPAKAAKPAAADSDEALWPMLLKALSKQFPDKTLPEEEKAFKKFLIKLETDTASDCLLSYLYSSCRMCSLFEGDFEQSDDTVFEKCQKVVDELVDCRLRQKRRLDATSPTDEQVTSAWTAPYRDSEAVLDVFLKYIQDCNGAFRPLGHWHSPFIALCQSSGWGKSRLLSELGRRVPVLYLSFLEQDSSGFPQSTKQTNRNLMELKRTGSGYGLDHSLWLQTICHVDTLYSAATNKQMINLDTLECSWNELKKMPTKNINLSNDLIVIAFDEADDTIKRNRSF